MNTDSSSFVIGLILSSCLHLGTLAAFVWMGIEVKDECRSHVQNGSIDICVKSLPPGMYLEGEMPPFGEEKP